MRTLGTHCMVDIYIYTLHIREKGLRECESSQSLIGTLWKMSTKDCLYWWTVKLLWHPSLSLAFPNTLFLFINCVIVSPSGSQTLGITLPRNGNWTSKIVFVGDVTLLFCSHHFEIHAYIEKPFWHFWKNPP